LKSCPNKDTIQSNPKTKAAHRQPLIIGGYMMKCNVSHKSGTNSQDKLDTKLIWTKGGNKPPSTVGGVELDVRSCLSIVFRIFVLRSEGEEVLFVMIPEKAI
jgi:hypothetical protein